jgi:hypothetical protein
MHLTRQYRQIHMPKRDRRAKRLADALHRQTGSCGQFLLGHRSADSQEHPLPPVKSKPHAIRQNDPTYAAAALPNQKSNVDIKNLPCVNSSPLALIDEMQHVSR